MNLNTLSAERSLIDAAIAAGRITYIPPGVSGLDDSGVPFGSIDRAIAAHKAWLARYDRAMMVPEVKAKKPARLQRFEWTPEQDALIRTMRFDGACYQQIAIALGMASSATSVWRRCSKLGVVASTKPYVCVHVGD